jgi:hypothetical protein
MAKGVSSKSLLKNLPAMEDRTGLEAYSTRSIKQFALT